jgi:hypothetical protein
VMSYCGDTAISFTSCRKLLRDPASYADSLRALFDARSAAETTPRRRERRRAAKSSMAGSA